MEDSITSSICLSICEDYSGSWKLWEGVRELVQNWYDGAIEMRESIRQTLYPLKIEVKKARKSRRKIASSRRHTVALEEPEERAHLRGVRRRAPRERNERRPEDVHAARRDSLRREHAASHARQSSDDARAKGSSARLFEEGPMRGRYRAIRYETEKRAPNTYYLLYIYIYIP